MYRDADLHPASGRLIVSQVVESEKRGLAIYDADGTLRRYLQDSYAQTPRWSPDGTRFLYSGNGRLYVYHLNATDPAQVIELPGHHAGFAEWSPDGTELIFSAYFISTTDPRPPDIYHYDFQNDTISRVTDSPHVDRFPKWHPAMSYVVLERTFVHQDGSHTGIVLVNLQDANTEQQILLSPGASQRLSRQCWSPDGTRLLVTEFTDDHSRLLVYDLEDNTIVQIAEPDLIHGCFHPIIGQILLITDTALRLLDADEYQTVAELNLSSLASVRQTFSGSVVTFADADVVCFLGRDSTYYRWQVNQSCDVMLRETHVPTVKIPAYQRDDYTFQASDGLMIPVQRYLPDDSNGAAVIFLEGGPGSAINPHDSIALTLLEAGYEVIRPAYRGCGGYGEAHQQANQNEYGRADVRDVVECGIDWRQRFNQPDAPLAVSGYSYGGYLTFLALARADDSLWTCGITFWGCTTIPGMSLRYGLPDDPAEYDRVLRERSPVRQAHRIRNPLLILHGERDTTSSVDDVQTICQQVQSADSICQVVIFEGETHALHGCRPQMYRHMLDFLATHMTSERLPPRQPL